MSESYDVVYIGAGPAGYVGAIKAAQLGLKTACIEEHSSLGGTCLNVGCIPSKALLHATELYHMIGAEMPKMGIQIDHASMNFEMLMQYKEQIVKKLTGGIQYLFKKNQVTHIRGRGKMTSPTTIQVDGQTITAKNIVIATGSEPMSLPGVFFDEAQIVSSTGALSLSKVPKTMIIVGGGVIGLELGSVYHALGAQIEVIEYLDHILPGFDSDLSSTFQKILEKRGFHFHLGAKVLDAKAETDQVTVRVEKGGKEETFIGDIALVAIGRKPNTKDLGLEEVGIETDAKGFIVIDDQFRTRVPNIYAVGDVVGQPMLAHKGSHEAVTVAYQLSGKHYPFEYTAIPNVVYTHPEIASVGFTEKNLQERGIEYHQSNFSWVGNSRYQANGGNDPAFVKALCHKQTGQLLGCHIIGPNASELIVIPTLGIQHRLTAAQLAHTCFPHPTLSEALHEAFLGLTGPFLHL